MVDLGRCNLDTELRKHLKLFGINGFRPFQYIMARCIIDSLGSLQGPSGKTVAAKYIFYNEGGTGRSLGYILPLLHIYGGKRTRTDVGHQGKDSVSSDGTKEDLDAKPVDTPPGMVLIVTKNGHESRDLASLITAMNPAGVSCVTLDQGANGDDLDGTIGATKMSAEMTQKLLHHGRTHIVVVSIGKLEHMVANRSPILAAVTIELSCVIFDDLSKYLDRGGIVTQLYRHIQSAKLKPKTTGTAKLKVTSSNSHVGISNSIAGTSSSANSHATTINSIITTDGDIHIICVVHTLGEAFCKFATEHLGGYWLYDFKNGTKQRLIGDGRTDAVRLEVDLNEQPEIVNVATGLTGQQSIEHSICRVPNGKNKRDRAYTLESLVYHYVNLPTFQVQHMLPQMIKRPRASHQCIIFVANRSQQRQLCALEPFRDVATRLGSDLTVKERATNLNCFRDGTRPIMIATDASVSGLAFDNVRYIINYHPPKNVEIYRSRAGIAGKNSNSLCITLYSKEQYPALAQILKSLKKRVSIHVPPSRDYMYRFNAAWLERFGNELTQINPSFIQPFVTKAKELLEHRDKDMLYSKILALLLGDGTGEALADSSILSGRRGFTAVTVFDANDMPMEELKSLIQAMLPDTSVAAVLGKYAKTESGYVIDVATEHVPALLEAASVEHDLCLEVPRALPTLILGRDNGLNRAKGHMNRLPWRRYKIRRLQLQKRMVTTKVDQ
ncbi:hypothetical protein BaOVIS_017150 [Babesia ovis]|uniref:ATP-dependent RNA helicase n=1 Tax=Babesia ovis TaxID=5869 RepID=A0A9W5WUV7_BABOV|nr:hypothetical protein BaOVIS_017150 [Babesia ovis]